MKVSELIVKLHELLVKHGGDTEVKLYNEYGESLWIGDDEVNYHKKLCKIIIGVVDENKDE